MFPIKHCVLYRTPEEHQPPDDSSLAGNTEYPNLNSRDYAKRPLNRHIRMHQPWECIAVNTEQEAIIATNKLSGREWSGSLWGFENVGDGTTLKPAKACYKLQCQTLISCLQFIADNIFMVAMRSGRVQLWSTKSEVRNPHTPYCMFLIGEKCEHMRPITCLNVKTNAEHAITGSKDGTLKVWDIGCGDLFSVHTFRYAHTDVVTSIATSHKEPSVFATSSLDRSTLLWDDRLTRPALGDESGFVHTVDERFPNKFVQSSRCLNRSIHKMVPIENKIAVIGDTNIVKVIDANNHSIIYTNDESQNFVRDAVWKGASKLLTIGYEGKLRIHNLL
ncbi:protein valois isoform X2 [Rhagoletis pomonella]|uniref:protein valois isoform X2 n=1 Tax=Rhagoletis pomonella TaxID=28610 RepID=UPI001781E005|nr:protein valois isoform X2 [Rhagoletis pomonella]